MFIIIDIVILLILVIGTIRGYHTGFIRTVMRLVTKIAAFVAAYIFASPVAKILNKKIFHKIISGKIRSELEEIASSTEQALFSGGRVSESVGAMIERLGLNASQTEENVAQSVSQGGQNLTDAVANSIATPISNGVSYVLAFLLIFAIVLIGLTVLTGVLDLIAKLPVIRGANKLLGTFAGLFASLISAWIFTIVLKLVFPYLSALSVSVFPADALDKSLLFGIIYSMNILKGVFYTLEYTRLVIK